MKPHIMKFCLIAHIECYHFSRYLIREHRLLFGYVEFCLSVASWERWGVKKEEEANDCQLSSI